MSLAKKLEMLSTIKATVGASITGLTLGFKASTIAVFALKRAP